MSFCCYYLDIETVPYPEFMDYPGAKTDPSKAKIISIQYCPLHTRSGEPIGDIKILSDWRKNRSEKIILDLFRKIYLDGGCWSFVPVGNNLAYECEFLEYKYRLFYGLSGLKLAQRPMIDIKPILVIKNHGFFKGSSLCIGKTGEAKHMTEWYYNKEFGKIETYILTETINFINAYQTLKAKIPEIKFSGIVDKEQIEWHI